MATKFVLFLFFLVVEGEQFGSLKYSYWFLVLCSTVITWQRRPIHAINIQP